MAWEAVEFRDRHGNLIGEKPRETLLRLIERALGKTPDADPSALMSAASTACLNIDTVRNFYAYANRTIFRAARKGYVAECKAQALVQPLRDGVGSVGSRAVAGEEVEQQILIDELLNTLASIDREIYVRHLNGQSFPRIDEALSLRPRTSEYRFREAQVRIRKALSTRPPR